MRLSHRSGPHADPYWQWTAKVEGQTVTRVLSEDQVERYRAWMDNAQRLDRIVSELFDLSAQADEVLRALEREAASAKKKQQRPKRSGSRSRAARPMASGTSACAAERPVGPDPPA